MTPAPWHPDPDPEPRLPAWLQTLYYGLAALVCGVVLAFWLAGLAALIQEAAHWLAARGVALP